MFDAETGDRQKVKVREVRLETIDHSAVASHRRPLGPETDRKPGTATVTILRLLIADSKEDECRKSA